MDRESIIAGVARTLFLCAYADGVESGALQGDAARGGQDWDDIAPQAGDPSASSAARSLVDRFDAAAKKTSALGPLDGDYAPTPIEDAARLHAELSGTDRFPHCLAMQALGQGVGLEDDLPGVRLPEWIGASVPRIEFGPWELGWQYQLPTVVLFRRWPKSEGGDVLALFPLIPETSPGTCSSYQRVGQHGAASLGIISSTVPAGTDEPDVIALRRELQTIGYNLDIRTRLPGRKAIKASRAALEADS